MKRRILITTLTATLVAGLSAAVLMIPAAQAAVVSGTTYTVVNKGNGKCVDARAAASANGTAVQQYACNGTAAQQWRLDDGGWASGGWFSDVKVDGQVNSGSQQQWISRNSQFGSWAGSNWNMVLASGTRFHNMVTVSLGGTGTINRVINNTGGTANSSNNVVNLVSGP